MLNKFSNGETFLNIPIDQHVGHWLANLYALQLGFWKLSASHHLTQSRSGAQSTTFKMQQEIFPFASSLQVWSRCFASPFQMLKLNGSSARSASSRTVEDQTWSWIFWKPSCFASLGFPSLENWSRISSRRLKCWSLTLQFMIEPLMSAFSLSFCQFDVFFSCLFQIFATEIKLS